MVEVKGEGREAGRQGGSEKREKGGDEGRFSKSMRGEVVKE